MERYSIEERSKELLKASEGSIPLGEEQIDDRGGKRPWHPVLRLLHLMAPFFVPSSFDGGSGVPSGGGFWSDVLPKLLCAVAFHHFNSFSSRSWETDFAWMVGSSFPFHQRIEKLILLEFVLFVWNLREFWWLFWSCSQSGQPDPSWCAMVSREN